MYINQRLQASCLASSFAEVLILTIAASKNGSVSSKEPILSKERSRGAAFRPRKSSPAENQNAAGLQIITFYKIAAGRYELLSKATNIMLSKSK